MVKTNDKRKCFIITPIGSDNSDTFRRAKGVIESAIKPVLKSFDYDDIKPAYEINVSGMINTQIINRIIEDDLVIANLTGNNPNVMYELCLRHVVAKPIIHICERGTNLPFDIKDSRTIFYENDMLGVKELRTEISKYMREINYNEDYMDNPIYSAYKYGKLLKETQGTENNEILTLLMDIKDEVSKTERNKEFVFSFPDYEQEEYTFGQLSNDTNEINKRTVVALRKYLKESQNFHRIRVHELAKELGTKSQTIIEIANLIGINLKSAQSGLDEESCLAILKYIEKHYDD